MTKNQKIALGCGGGGCLGLILLVIVGVVLVVTGIVPAPGLYNANRKSKVNIDVDQPSNYNSNLNSNANDNSNSDSSSSMTDSDKHKLYQAAAITKDNALIFRMLKKIGLGDGTGSDHQQFLKEHIAWAFKNEQFVQSINTPETARAYFDAHIDD
jgi:hypothetical protein